MERRSMLAGLVAALPSLVGRASHAEAEAPRPATRPMLFDWNGQLLRVRPVEGTLELADRREVLGRLPQPEPVGRVEYGKGLHALVWDRDPSAACARCPSRCNAQIFADGRIGCFPEGQS